MAGGGESFNRGRLKLWVGAESLNRGWMKLCGWSPPLVPRNSGLGAGVKVGRTRYGDDFYDDDFSDAVARTLIHPPASRLSLKPAASLGKSGVQQKRKQWSSVVPVFAANMPELLDPAVMSRGRKGGPMPPMSNRCCGPMPMLSNRCCGRCAEVIARRADTAVPGSTHV